MSHAGNKMEMVVFNVRRQIIVVVNSLSAAKDVSRAIEKTTNHDWHIKKRHPATQLARGDETAAHGIGIGTCHSQGGNFRSYPPPLFYAQRIAWRTPNFYKKNHIFNSLQAPDLEFYSVIKSGCWFSTSIVNRWILQLSRNMLPSGSSYEAGEVFIQPIL